MANKNVLITGARNTALVTAKYLAARGWNIHLASRGKAQAKAAADEIKLEFPDINAYGYELEQGDINSVYELFRKIRENTDSLDGYVANAADLGVDLDIFNTTPDAFDSVMDVNVKGTFFMCREAGKLMTKNGGSIVLLGSVQSMGAVEGRTVYSISKAAVRTMSKALAYDFAPYSIRVNCLIAGAIHTDRWDELSEESAKARRVNYPLGREADMTDIANGIWYFLSDESKSTTGAELLIDSGVMLPILPYTGRKEFKRETYK